MKNDDKDFNHESLQDRDTIVRLLSSLQRGLGKGTVRFSDEDNEIVLKPSGLLNLVIKASSSAELNAIDLRISWQKDRSAKLKKELKVSDR